jgi:uncharacterized repeat protein (TIGR03803 family)
MTTRYLFLAALGLAAFGLTTSVTAAPRFEFTEPAVMTKRTGTGSRSTLVQGADGALYGTAQFGGPHGKGTIYRHAPGSALTAVHGFSGADGADPMGSLISMADGSLWGTAGTGGAYGHGTIFRFEPASGHLQVVHSFDGNDGHLPESTLILARDGYLYGTSVGSLDYEPTQLPGSMYRIDPATWQFTLIRRFARSGPESDLGRQPNGQLLQARDGHLYGASYLGGANDGGVLFRHDPMTGAFEKIHDFGGIGGCKPFGPLIQARDQRLYGTTTQCGALGGGTAFRVRSGGRIEAIHAFQAFDDAYFPVAGLLEASDGFLYGSSHDLGYGSLFRMRLDGSRYQRFFEFGYSDGLQSQGEFPDGTLIELDGALWGTTSAGSVVGIGGSIYQVKPLPAR